MLTGRLLSFHVASSVVVTGQVSGSFSYHCLQKKPRGPKVWCDFSIQLNRSVYEPAACLNLQIASAPLTGLLLLSFAAALSLFRLICCLFQCFCRFHCHGAPSLYGNPRLPTTNDERLLTVRFFGLTLLYVRAFKMYKRTNL